VLYAVGGDLGAVPHLPQVAHQQTAPRHLGRTPAAVTQREPGAERQLGRRVPVGPGRQDLLAHLGEAGLDLPGFRARVVERPDEILRLVVQRLGTLHRSPGRECG
jgi:hypothetical protein